MISSLYSWVIYPLGLGVGHVIGFFQAKVRATLRLRSWKEELKLGSRANVPLEYWVHVASSGELEYAIPILEELNRIAKKVLVTFYSISAKDPVKSLPEKFPCVALAVPLPHDGFGAMAEFVSLAKQQGVHTLLLLKYELWPGLLWECNRLGVKVILVDALKPSWFHQKLIHKLYAILAGFPEELETVRHSRRLVVGDTRVARVSDRLNRGEQPALVRAFRGLMSQMRPLLVCGSMWPSDHQVLLDALTRLSSEGLHDRQHLTPPHIFWLPHELRRRECLGAEKSFQKLGFETVWVETVKDLERVPKPERPIAFIIFKKGILVELYKLAHMAFVGGGFGSNVHSVWEAALAGCAVACGPRTARSPESKELGSLGLLSVVENGVGLQDWLKREMVIVNRQDQEAHRTRGKALSALLRKHENAAKKIVEFCEESNSGPVLALDKSNVWKRGFNGK